MRTFTFKSLFLTVLFVLLGSLAIQAADDGLITRQITLKLDEAGTLPNMISESQKYLITNLKIVGKINGTDLKFIREMAGCDFNVEKTDGKLSILDLSEAKIVAGGSAYVRYRDNKYTSNDKLGDYVFYDCSGLTSLTLPSSVTSIGAAAFRGCSGLTSLTIPSSVTSIGGSAFSGCSGLTSLTIPSSVTSISGYAFWGCSGLTSLTIPSGVTEIGDHTFNGCSGLTSLTIPSGVTSIGWDAFYGCRGLTSLTLPSSITSIGNYAFAGCRGLTSLTIPSSVTSIGENAFHDCSGLTSIYVYPENLPELGTGIFYGCDAKNCTVYVPKGTYDAYKSSEFGYFENIVDGINKDGLFTTQVTIKLDEAGTLPDRIGENQKYLITNLKIVGKINGTDLKFIREMAGCDFNVEKTDGKLSILDLSEAKIVAGGSAYVLYYGNNIYTSNDKLGDSAFYGCSGLTSLTIPSGVTSIGGGAFYYCSGLTSLTIPSGVTWIGSEAFRGCSGLTSLTIPSGVTSISDFAFYGCSGLTSLTIPSGVTSISDFAFKGCSGLTILTLPSSVTSIGWNAFEGCSSLTSIYAYLEKIPKLGSKVFTGCDAKNCTVYVPKGTYDAYKSSEFGYFENIVDGINKDGLFTTQVTIKLDEAGTLPDRIGENQKYLITNLKIVGKINGTDLKFIREMAGCDFNVEKTDGKLSILDLSEAKIVAGGSAYVLYYSYNMYTSNDKLGNRAFYGCSGLTSLTIPSGVTEIDDEAFYGCSGLTSLTIPSSVTEIGTEAFRGCSGLTSLTILSGVTSIGGYAFNGCSGLTSLTIPSSVTSIGNGAFEGCSGLTSLTIPSSVTSIGELAFYGCSGLTSLTIPSGVTSIGDGTFSGCSGLTSLAIPSGVTSIGRYAFKGCSGLTSLTIPSGVTSIGGYAFQGCSGLTSLTIPSSVTSIGDWGFYGCSGLTSLTIPSGVTSIGNDAFRGCSGLTSLTIPSGVTSIGNYAFRDCSGLTSLTIPSSVTSISDRAFSGCSGLTSIYVYPENLPELGTDIFNGCDAKNCTVYVPKGTYDAYKSSEFGYFEKIVEFDASGIDKVTTSTNAKEVSRYSANGQRLSAPAKGLNIVKYSDGSVKKVAVE